MMATYRMGLLLVLGLVLAVQSGCRALENPRSVEDVLRDLWKQNGPPLDLGVLKPKQNAVVVTAANYKPDTQEQMMQRLATYDKLVLDKKDLASSAKWQNSSVDSTIRQLVVVHRHGDRTPVSFPPKDFLKPEPFWQFHGYGQLTNKGKARLFILGSMIRHRYNNFFKGSVNKNQRVSRASGSLRCIESAQMFLSAFLGLNQPSGADSKHLRWDQEGNPLSQVWQPASVQSVPVKLDGMMAEGADCKDLDHEYDVVIDAQPLSKSIFAKNKQEGELLTQIMGYTMDHFYKWFWAAGQISVESTYFPEKVNPKLYEIMPALKVASDLSMVAYQSTVKARRLRYGLLINDIIKNMKKVRDAYRQRAPEDSLKKLLHYTGHDVTVVVLMGMFDNYDERTVSPDFASNMVMELHQDGDEWFVKAYYMARVPGPVEEVHMSRCEGNHPKRRCTLDNLESVLAPYLVPDWQTWFKECQNDVRTLDPYEPGS